MLNIECLVMNDNPIWWCEHACLALNVWNDYPLWFIDNYDEWYESIIQINVKNINGKLGLLYMDMVAF